MDILDEAVAALKRGGDVSRGTPGRASLSDADYSAVNSTAGRLGISPQDLLTVINYETNGTFSPSIMGGKNGQHLGLIQFGPEERRTFGAHAGQSFSEQIGAVERYLRGRGLPQGATLETLYRTINGGNPAAPLSASDGNGTIAQHVAKMQASPFPMPATAAAPDANMDGLSALDEAVKAIKAKASQASPEPSKPFLDRALEGLETLGIAGKMYAQDSAVAQAKGFRDANKWLLSGAARVGNNIVNAANAVSPSEIVMRNTVPGYSAAESARAKERAGAIQDFRDQNETQSLKPLELVPEVASTAGIGNLLALPLKVMGVLPRVQAALSSGGFNIGGASGSRVADHALRAFAGATVGAGGAAAVNPDTAATGAVIGGALPGVVQLSGALGSGANRLINGPVQSPDAIAGIEAARKAGYVIPPTHANPTIVNRFLEGSAGKLTTAQNASARNAAVTAELAAREVGLPAGTKITVQELDKVRSQAGKAYDALASTGVVTPGPTYFKELDDVAKNAVAAMKSFPNAKVDPIIDVVESLKTNQFDAGSAVAMMRKLRADADTAYGAGDKAMGGKLKQASMALENALEDHLVKIGAPTEMLQQFRDARQLIAKTYTVQGALNPTTGSVDARKLAADLKRGKPLSGGLRDAAEFSGRFPKAAQNIEQMGSLPGLSPLDFAVGGVGGFTNPLLAATVAARPMTRYLALSPVVQNRLASQPTQYAGDIANAFANPALRNMLYLNPAAAIGQ